jgi:dienelactone hydrolase
MARDVTLAGYERFDFTDGPWTRPVFKRSSGPAVIIMHEMPGLHPLVLRFAERVADAGMTVYLPSLFGKPGKVATAGYALGEMVRAICISREFHVWSGGGSSPIVEWLRALAMMTEPAVVAPVLSQPSLPLNRKGEGTGIDASPAEVACVKKRLDDEDLTLMGLRFKGDPFVPQSRFDRLREAFGDRFEAVELEDADALPIPGRPPHSVLTLNLRDEPGSATKTVEEKVIAFFKQRTAA